MRLSSTGGTAGSLSESTLGGSCVRRSVRRRPTVADQQLIARLPEILAAHGKWWRGGDGGVRANLCDADLSGADLSDADLCDADLT
ncbi:MAG: pentapeptide repeat-containing protein, partial [Myxococcales bacterium]|nr:pentapeptide repeat-containing protein [Myxococcales bacterium]